MSAKIKTLLGYFFLVILIVILAAFVGTFAGPSNFKNVCLAVMTTSIGLAILAGCVFAVFSGEYRYGQIGSWQDQIKRTDRPIGFWFVIFFMGLLGGVMLLLGIQCFYLK
ncbi:hypothetical protein GN109_24130 [Collimonas pratensis]|uniref:hypothetical protein n=1 Tax=Collimonas pratensis TaxID=279113 RepID=UPI00143DB057|nr:hypothetical protein [Collimonas pratensis]NKI72515.1 hypothetical protein [Collimonas pratensis]